MKLAFIRLASFFDRTVTTLQQIADNTSLSVEEVLNLDSIEDEPFNQDYINGSMVVDVVNSKINGAGNVQYWKGVVSNV